METLLVVIGMVIFVMGFAVAVYGKGPTKQTLSLMLAVGGLALAILSPLMTQKGLNPKPTVTAPAPEQKKSEGSAILRALELEKVRLEWKKVSKENDRRTEIQMVNNRRLVKEMEKKGVACDIWRGGGGTLSSTQWLDIYECARFAERINKNVVLAKTLSYAREKSLRIRVFMWTNKSEPYAGEVALSAKESDDEIIAFLLGCNPEKNLNACPQDFQGRYGKLSDPYIRGGRSVITQ